MKFSITGLITAFLAFTTMVVVNFGLIPERTAAYLASLLMLISITLLAIGEKWKK
jgi:predicted membrane metal-binding protein